MEKDIVTILNVPVRPAHSLGCAASGLTSKICGGVRGGEVLLSWMDHEVGRAERGTVRAPTAATPHLQIPVVRADSLGLGA